MEQQKFKCCECEQVFIDEDLLDFHQVIKHKGNKPFKCEKCDEKFCGIDQLLTHRGTHTSDSGQVHGFDCHRCGKRYLSPVDYDTHVCIPEQRRLATYDDDKQKAMLLSNGFELKNFLEQTQLIVKTVGASEVGENSMLNVHVQALRQNEHTDNVDVSSANVDDETSTNASKYSLRRTLRTEMSFPPLTNGLSKKRKKCEPTKRKCTFCERKLKGMSSLRSHLSSFHSLRRSTAKTLSWTEYHDAHVCSICNQNYFYENELQAHIKTEHEPESNARHVDSKLFDSPSFVEMFGASSLAAETDESKFFKIFYKPNVEGEQTKSGICCRLCLWKIEQSDIDQLKTHLDIRHRIVYRNVETTNNIAYVLPMAINTKYISNKKKKTSAKSKERKRTKVVPNTTIVEYARVEETQFKAMYFKKVNATTVKCLICHVILRLAARSIHIKKKHSDLLAPQMTSETCKKLKETNTMIKCRFCKTMWTSKVDFIEHINSQHANVDATTLIYKCQTCYEVHDKTSIEQHKSTHVQSIARKQATTKRPLAEITETDQMNKKKKLSVQGASLDTASNGQTCQCSECGMIFSEWKLTVIHRHEAHGLDLLSCHLCDRLYNVNQSLTAHISNYHKISKDALNDDDKVNRLSVKIKPPTTNKRKGKLYPCPDCEKVFQSSSGRCRHKVKYHPKVQTGEKIANEQTSITENYTCGLCQRAFDSCIALDGHYSAGCCV